MHVGVDDIIDPSSIRCFLAVFIGWSKVSQTHGHGAFGVTPHQPSVLQTL